MRLAWFSPMPPIATGIARCSADLVAGLAPTHEIDVFVDQRNLPARGQATTLRSAHEFAPRQLQRPYDLIVYQLGNSSHHDYQWPYLFRYPGLVVLHDAHLHHARAACLLRTLRSDDYRTEFAWNHPQAPPAAAELAVAGFNSHLHYAWPMTRLVVARARAVVVHSPGAAERLRDESPSAAIRTVRLGHGMPVSAAEAPALGAATRARLGISEDAFVFGCFGGLTPDKRLSQVLDAFAAIRPHVPSAHLLLAGSVPAAFDVRPRIDALGLRDCCTLTGYLATDEELTGCVVAADVALSLRWPTAREISGPWLRCLAAGTPTVTIDLLHTADVPAVDPRTWHAGGPDPCTVAIDILDEAHSLRLAMKRLATDEQLRASLAESGRRYWAAHHSIEGMVEDYRALIDEVRDLADPPADLPTHLLSDGSATLRTLVADLGVTLPIPLGA
jgi:glycosyltransferase involved in cell wall biosynthesis